MYIIARSSPPCRTAEKWEGRAYSRETSAFPAPWVRQGKLWPTVGRVDNVYGDRNLVCTCPPVESYVYPQRPFACQRVLVQ